MKHLLLILLINLFTFLNSSKAQSIADSIQIYKSGFRNVYAKNGEVISNQELYRVLSKNPETLKDISLAKTNNFFGKVFSGAGGFILGYQLGTKNTRFSTNWFAIGTGATFLVLTIPFEIAKAQHTKKAVLIYNKDFLKTSSLKPSYNIGLSNNGISLKITF